MTVPAYPKYLLKSESDKNKGIIAKIRHGETGIGAALDKVKEAYDAVGFAKLQKATGNTNSNTAKGALDGITQQMAKDALGHLPKLEQALMDTGRLAVSLKDGLKPDATVLKVPILLKVTVPDKAGDSKMDDYLGYISASSHKFPGEWIYLKECLTKISQGKKLY